MIKTIDRGRLRLSPRRKCPTCCGVPSSEMRKSDSFSPCTGRPCLSRTSISETTSEVSIVMTSSSSDRVLVSVVELFCGSHFSFLRLEPKSFSLGFSPVWASARPGRSNRRRDKSVWVRRVICHWSFDICNLCFVSKKMSECEHFQEMNHVQCQLINDNWVFGDDG